MCTKNMKDWGLVNGSRGVVTSFVKDEVLNLVVPMVKFDNGDEISMCEWSGGDDDGKCITNTDWRDDQSMCGYPCLSRMDAKTRECKFSDDCEIRDRDKVEA